MVSSLQCNGLHASINYTAYSNFPIPNLGKKVMSDILIKSLSIKVHKKKSWWMRDLAL